MRTKAGIPSRLSFTLSLTGLFSLVATIVVYGQQISDVLRVSRPRLHFNTQSKDFNLGYKYEGINTGSRSFIQALADRADPIAKALGLTFIE
ncbi:MAG: hypothetical protein ACREOO_16515 [bacterium]